MGVSSTSSSNPGCADKLLAVNSKATPKMIVKIYFFIICNFLKINT
jgi:hypothetical protein